LLQKKQDDTIYLLDCDIKIAQSSMNFFPVRIYPTSCKCSWRTYDKWDYSLVEFILPITWSM